MDKNDNLPNKSIPVDQFIEEYSAHELDEECACSEKIRSLGNWIERQCTEEMYDLGFLYISDDVTLGHGINGDLQRKNQPDALYMGCGFHRFVALSLFGDPAKKVKVYFVGRRNREK